MNLPPIHPALVHLPIAFVILSVVSDFAARITKNEARRAVLRTLGFWSLVAALIGGALSIAAGYLDLSRASLSSETHDFVQLHLAMGWILGVSLAILTAWRWLIWHRGQMTINTAYLVGGSFVLVLTLFQGWYGGEMVYSYGAGVVPAGQGTETAEAARSRLIAVRNLILPNDSAIGGAEGPGGTNSLNSAGGNDPETSAPEVIPPPPDGTE